MLSRIFTSFAGIIISISAIAFGTPYFFNPDQKSVDLKFGRALVSSQYTLYINKAGTGSGTVTGGSRINCGSICSASFNSGDMVGLDAVPGPGSIFAGWSSPCSGTGGCVFPISSNQNITATFNEKDPIPSVAISASSTLVSSGGTTNISWSVSPSGDSRISCTAGGTDTNWRGPIKNIGYTSTSQPLYSPQTYSVTCSSSSGSDSKEVAVNVQYTLNVLKSGTGSGKVTGNNGINCGNTCSAVYNYGNMVGLDAVPGPGSIFAGWSSPCSGTGGCVFPISSNQNITATFNLIPSTGTVCINANTNDNYFVQGPESWGWNGSKCFPGHSIGTYSVNAPGGISSPASQVLNKDQTITFTVIMQHTLNVAKYGTGSGLITGVGISCGGDCSEIFNQGDTIELTHSENPGSVWGGWSGACTGPGCIVVMDSDKNVTGTFNAVSTPTPVSTPPTLTPTPNGTLYVSSNIYNCFTILRREDSQTWTKQCASYFNAEFAPGTYTIMIDLPESAYQYPPQISGAAWQTITSGNTIGWNINWIPTSSSPTPTPPRVTVSVSRPQVNYGENITVTWSVSGEGILKCFGTGNWSGWSGAELGTTGYSSSTQGGLTQNTDFGVICRTGYYEGSDSKTVSVSSPTPTPVPPTPTPIPEPTPPSTPAIRVISPNGGEQWVIGREAKISWARNWQPSGANGLADIYIQNYFNPSDKRFIAGGVADEAGFSWVVPEWLDANSAYKIVVTSQGFGSLLSDESDNFFNVRPPVWPTINLISPNGGEALLQNRDHTISWKSENAPQDAKVIIFLLSKNEIVGQIGESKFTSGSYIWRPSGYAVGNEYSIEVLLQGIQTDLAKDVSDSSFKIVSVFENKKPAGWVDGITADGIVSGWAYDPNDPAKSIQVHAYFDGPAGSGINVTAGTASVPRSDVNDRIQIPGDHGFQIRAPDVLRDGKSHRVFAYGIDLDDLSGASNELLLPREGRSFTISSVSPVNAPQNNVSRDSNPPQFINNFTRSAGNGKSVLISPIDTAYTFKTTANSIFNELLFSNTDYDYDPSVIAEGNFIKFWWCGYGGRQGSGDSIYYRAYDSTNNSWSNITEVFKAAATGFDSFHVCNPSVIKGSFNADGQSYSYALYYSAGDEAQDGGIGVAFSNDGTNWLRYSGNPVVRSYVFPVPAGSYGAGNQEVFYYNNQVVMVYNDTTYGLTTVRTSNDGINFSPPVRASSAGIYTGFGGVSGFTIGNNSRQIYAAFTHPANVLGARAESGFSIYRINAADFIQGQGQWEYISSLDFRNTNKTANFSPGFIRDGSGPIDNVSSGGLSVYFSYGDAALTSSWDLARAVFPLDTKPLPVGNQTPVANFDGIADGSLAGWAYDPNNTGASLAVHVYFDGPAGTSTNVIGAATDILRTDVNDFYSISGNHGFLIPIPASLRDGRTHTAYIYVIDYNDPNENMFIPVPIEFRLNASTGPSVVPVSGSRSSVFRDGALYFYDEKLWVIEFGQRRVFYPMRVFSEMGYSLANVKFEDISSVPIGLGLNISQQRHPRGTVVKDGNTWYFLGQDVRYPMTTLEEFSAWGNLLDEVVPANSFDLALPVGQRQTPSSNIGTRSDCAGAYANGQCLPAQDPFKCPGGVCGGGGGGGGGPSAGGGSSSGGGGGGGSMSFTQQKQIINSAARRAYDVLASNQQCRDYLTNPVVGLDGDSLAVMSTLILYSRIYLEQDQFEPNLIAYAIFGAGRKGEITILPEFFSDLNQDDEVLVMLHELGHLTAKYTHDPDDWYRDIDKLNRNIADNCNLNTSLF